MTGGKRATERERKRDKEDLKCAIVSNNGMLYEGITGL
jgi:hypothetical protein